VPEFRDKQDRAKVTAAIRDRLLNHKDPTVRGRHYDFHDCYPEKRSALRLWNDWLDGLKVEATGNPPQSARAANDNFDFCTPNQAYDGDARFPHRSADLSKASDQQDDPPSLAG
jgi:hypothetical protein